MFYDSVTKQVRNSYKCSCCSAGFGLNYKDTVTMCNNFWKYNTKVENQSRISQKYAKCMHESGTNKEKFVTILNYSRYFLS